MRVPKRKGEEDRRKLKKNGPIYVTQTAIDRAESRIKQIKKELPSVVAEVQETREMGDLSENAAYQIAKSKMRRMQSETLKLQDQLKRMVLIEKDDSGRVGLGSTFIASVAGKERTFTIVDSYESNPMEGLISRHSPVAKALRGHKAGDVVQLTLNGREIEYKILNVT